MVQVLERSWRMKILLVDDHVLYREGLASLLDAQPGLIVVGSAASMEAAVVFTNELQPELVLMDFSLPDGNGLDYIHLILDQYPQIKVVFLTMHTDDTLILEALAEGATGYLRKNIPVDELLEYIHSLGQEETTFSPSSVDG